MKLEKFIQKTNITKYALETYTQTKANTQYNIQKNIKLGINNYQQKKRTWRPITQEQSILPYYLLLKLSLKQHKLLHVKKNKTSKILETLIQLIQLKPKIYYEGLGNTSLTPKKWPEADNWLKMCKKYEINNKKIKNYKILENFQNHNKKICTCLILKYKNSINNYQTQKTLQQFIKTHPLKKIRKIKIRTYNHKNKKEIIIIIYTNKRRPQNATN